MITRITIRNFKRIKEASIDLRDNVILVGPNNYGKTSALQALAVWRLALTRWLEKREKAKKKATLRTGVAITRSDFSVMPLRDMRYLWNNCFVQDSNKNKIRMEILVEGSAGVKEWKLGMELEFQGSEMIYVRPMRVSPDDEERMMIPDEARGVTIGHLPPLAGLQRSEEKANERSIRTRISEGRAGDILRNLLYNVSEKGESQWNELRQHIIDIFQVELLKPQFVGTGEIVVEYYNGLTPEGKKSNPHTKLDLGMGGSGFHQVLLLLAFLYDQGGVVLLYDEPDAHLEVIRQRDVYTLLRKLAQERGSQLIVATHSEEIMENTDFSNIYAFLGDSPVPLASEQEKKQIRKSLFRISSSDYLKAKERGAVLYVEDFTDVDILREWARKLDHPLAQFLTSPFAIYIGNVPKMARNHFDGLKTAYTQLKGVLLIDHTDTVLQNDPLTEMMWRRREIENYLLVPNAIIRLCMQLINEASGNGVRQGNLFTSQVDIINLLKKESRISEDEFTAPLNDSPYLLDVKASDVILAPFFKEFFKQSGRYNIMPKNTFYRIAAIMEKKEIHPEVIEKLDTIVKALDL